MRTRPRVGHVDVRAVARTEMHGDFSAQITRLAAGRQQQLPGRRARKYRIEDQLVPSLPIEHAGVQRPCGVEAVIESEVPGAAARRPQILHGRRERCGRSERGRPIQLIPLVDDVWKHGEGADRGRSALVKQPEAAANNRGAGLVEQQRAADTRRDVEAIDHAVAIHAQAELHIPARIRLIPILREQRHVGRALRLPRQPWRKRQRPRQRAVSTLDQHRPAQARAVVRVAQQIDAAFEEVRAALRAFRPRERRDDLIGHRLPMLLVEEVAGRRVGQELHRRRPLGQHVRFETVHVHRRFAEQRVGPHRALGRGDLVRADARVDRGVGRRERAEQIVVRPAREPAEGADERVPGRHVRIDAGERTERRRRVQQVFRQARDIHGAVDELHRLLEEQPVLHDGSAEFDARRFTAEPDDLDGRSTMRAERRIDVVDSELPRVASAPRLDHDDAG